MLRRLAEPATSSATRRAPVAVAGVAVAALVAAVALTACSDDGRELADAVAPLPTTTTSTSVPGAPPVSPTEIPALDLPTVITGGGATDPIGSGSPASATGPSVPARVVIDELSSPENAVALAIGSGAVTTDQVTVDGADGDVVSFDVAEDGTFEMRVFIPDEGAHTVCVGDACGRVYTLDPDADTPEEVVAKIEEAIPLANGIVPDDVWFPGWTIEIGGALSGTGGTADATDRTVTVYRNRGREVDDFVRTIVHEFGHVADATWLTDDQRAEFALLRGFDPEVAWEGNGGHRIEDWAVSPAEDFAEVVSAVWSAGRWEIRTAGGPLTDDVRSFVDALIVANT
jgi:hypothetical protein